MQIRKRGRPKNLSIFEILEIPAPPKLTKKQKARLEKLNAPPKVRKPRVKKGYSETALRIKEKEALSQAERVVRKFGGAVQLIRYLKLSGSKRNKTSVYRWLKPRERGGTGGRIPTTAINDILRAARLAGVLISASELDPRPIEKQPRIWRGTNVID